MIFLYSCFIVLLLRLNLLSLLHYFFVVDDHSNTALESLHLLRTELIKVREFCGLTNGP